MLLTGEDGVVRKFSCEKCIKGHRTSGCKHANSPLYEIKKKGRPSTQCEHCRELRKTKHIHVKCICPGRQTPDPLKSKVRTSPYSRETSPAQSREPSPTLMELDPAHHQLGNNFNSELSEPIYTSSVSSEGTMTPTESSASCSPNFPGNNQSEIQHASLVPDHEPTETKSDYMDMETSSPIDPFKLRYHLQRTINTALGGRPANSNSSSSPLYSPLTSPRTPPIPINDPTDDLDSDTPIYKNEDGEPAVDQAAVLGDLHHTSSEDLMDEIYSGFTEKAKDGHTGCGQNCQCGDVCQCTGCTLHTRQPSSNDQNRSDGQTNSSQFEPIIDEDGVQLCGCGCKKSLESCRDCFSDLCEEYLLGHPHP